MSEVGWSTPFVWRNVRRTELVVCGSGQAHSYDPATGVELWRLTGIQGVISATPAADAEHVYFGNNGPFTNGQLFAVNAGAKGDITPREGQATSDGVTWSRTSSGPGLSSPVVCDGRLYVMEYFGGILGCYDCKTGERVFRGRAPNIHQGVASLLACRDRLYVLRDDGMMVIVEAGSTMKVLGKNKLDDSFWSTPALIRDTLLLRSATAVYCVRKQ
jgi:outer membrane protein assembly factor BamB